MKKHHTAIFYAVFAAFLLLITTAPAIAQGAANPLAKDLYCQTFKLLSSDIGIFLGLIIAFLGFLLFITQEYPAASIIMIAFGVLLSAMPGFFISMLEGVAPILAPLSQQQGNNNQAPPNLAAKFQNLCP